MEQTFCRILLDLTELNFKEYKYVWMSLSDRELRTIGDFKDAVIRRFALESPDIKFFVHDGLLLEDEKIVVLRENDVVRVQYEDSADPIHYVSISVNKVSEQKEDSREFVTSDASINSSRKRKRKRSSVLNVSTEEHDQVEFKKKKKRKKSHKPSTPEVTLAADVSSGCVTFVQAPRDVLVVEKLNRKSDVHKSKKSMQMHDTSTLEINSFSPPVIQETCLSLSEKADNGLSIISMNGTKPCIKPDETPNGLKSDERGESLVSTDQPDILNVNENTSPLQGNNCKKKKKRKRHKKRKVPLNIVGSFEPNHDIPSFLPVQNQPNTDQYSSIRKHILFGSPISKVNHSEHNVLEETAEYFTASKSLDASPTLHLQSTATSNIFNPFSVSPMEKTAAAESVKKFIEVKTSSTHKKSQAGSSGLNYNNGSSFSSEKNHTNPDEYTYQQKHVLFDSSSICEKNREFDDYIATNDTDKTLEDSPTLPLKSNAAGNNSIFAVSPIKEKNGVSTKFTKKTDTCLSSEVKTSSKPLSDYLKFAHLFAPPKNKKSSQALGHRKIGYQNYKDYGNCAVLNALPAVGTSIAFKMLELDDNYSPVVSKYKEGKIISCPGPDQVEIELCEKEIKAGRVGKFENLKEDELPPDEVVENVVTSWSALVEPRLISLS